MLFTAALAVTISMTSQLRAAAVEDTRFPAPLPEWKTPAQLKVWRAETTAKTLAKEAADRAAQVKAVASSATPSGFYTGKPYMAESGTYAFKYREYNPEMGRWTTVDPSGFPDGANNQIYVNNSTLDSIDSTGKSITLYHHPVYIGYHAYIYYNDVKIPSGGSVAKGTISGEPSPDFRNLVYRPNADKDSSQQHSFTLNSSSYGYSSDWCILQDLLGSASSYGNNLTYDPKPTPVSGSFNSNGFINGLLSSLGIMDTGYSGFGWSEKVAFGYTAKYKQGNTTCESCE